MADTQNTLTVKRCRVSDAQWAICLDCQEAGRDARAYIIEPNAYWPLRSTVWLHRSGHGDSGAAIRYYRMV